MSQGKLALIEILIDAHHAAAVNNKNSISTNTLLNAYHGSSNPVQAKDGRGYFNNDFLLNDFLHKC